MERNNEIVCVENAHILFRNFSGEARLYNDEGNRNFNLRLDAEQAAYFRSLGYRVRERPPREEGDEPTYLLAVTVSYKYRAPHVLRICGKTRTELTEETIGQLDFDDLEVVDVTIRPYHWTMPNGQSGTKAYLNSMYATVVADPLMDKYAFEPVDEDLPF